LASDSFLYKLANSNYFKTYPVCLCE